MPSKESNHIVQTDYMQQLLDRGVAVIPFPPEIRTTFNREKFLSQQKEFVTISPENTTFVMGGFGAFGNPSSFHHEEVRNLRLAVYNHMFPLFQNTFPGKYIEGIVDRFAKRQPGTSVSPESWHRDISNVKKKKIHGESGDNIFGGWVNLDEAGSQFFTCVPSTHNEPTDGAGFSKITKEDMTLYNSEKEKICVPPNHLIIFNEKLVHAVTPSKVKNDSYRLFMKYRITNNPKCSLFDPLEISKIIDEQGVFPLSLEQMPPMYSKNHIRNWKPRLEQFSMNIKPEFLAQKKEKPKEKPKKNKSVEEFNLLNDVPATATADVPATVDYVMRFMPSLKQVGFELFSPYREEEKQMLTLVRL